mgnify:FL=1
MSTKVEFSTGTTLFVLDNLIKKDGYKPKSKFGGDCTAFVAEEELRNDGNHFASLSISDRVIELNGKILQSIQGEGINSFMRSCRDAVGLMEADGSWKLKQKIFNYQLGWLAALVNNIIRDENIPAKEDLSHLGYIGKQGKRGKFFVKLVDVISKDDYKIHKVVDKSGNRGHFYNYKFIAQDHPRPLNITLELNDCFLMTATPVRHEINKYDGGKGTYFNRITIEENKGHTS